MTAMTTILFFALLASAASALDLILKDVECDDLPISLVDNSMTIQCEGSHRCSLGKDATLHGKLQFLGVDDSGLVDGFAFVSANLELRSLEYELLHYLQVPICGQYVFEGQNNNGECPNDGVYEFSLPYVFPEEESKLSWLASGWEGTSEIAFYSEANNVHSVIGYCKLHFTTAVTPFSNKHRFAKVPSAFVTVLAVIAFASLLVLSCLYRLMRDVVLGKKKKPKGLLDEDESHSNDDLLGCDNNAPRRQNGEK